MITTLLLFVCYDNNITAVCYDNNMTAVCYDNNITAVCYDTSITAVFAAFIKRSFLLNQVFISATTLSILVWSNLSSLSEINTLISSANITKFASWIFTGRPFIYRRNNNAPVPNPVAHLDLFPCSRTCIYLPSYCLSHFDKFQ